MKANVQTLRVSCWLIFALPAATQAQFTFTTNNGTVTLTRYSGTSGVVVIPSTVGSYPVTGIGDYAFVDCLNLASLAIPDSVTSIGIGAFYDCFILPSVIIPNGVTNIGIAAFFDCAGLTNVTIGNSVTSIESDAFKGCSSLRSLTLPSTVTNVAGQAFAECAGLTSVTIPNGVTGIGGEAFLLCSSLTNISVSEGNPNYTSVGGVLFDKMVATLVQYPIGMTNNMYIVPIGVTNIDSDAFDGCTNLASVTIPDSVANIGIQAFADCSSLTSITIPSSLASLGEYAFTGCTGLTNVAIGEGVTSIDFAAFGGCTRIQNVTIPKGVFDAGAYMFAGCTNLTSAYFLGNAPTVDLKYGWLDTSVFSGDVGTVYYLPGTTGWRSTFGGWPTVQWGHAQPQVLGVSYARSAQSNEFKFAVSWVPNAAVVVSASTNLQDWTPLTTNMPVNAISVFCDTHWTNYPVRFYRVTAL